MWINSIVRAVTQEMWLNHDLVHRPEMFNHNLKEFVRQKKIDSLSYINADFKYVKELCDLKGFHVVRDPRDIVVSAYFSHLYSHKEVDGFPELKEYRDKLSTLPKDEGLILEMVKLRKKQFEAMYNWDYSMPNILEIKMEELICDSYNKFLEIFNFLDILNNSPMNTKTSLLLLLNRQFRICTNKVFAERLLGIIHQNRFSKKSGGRSFGEEDTKSHYRKGTPGDWKNHFNEEHIKLFKDNYNDLLLKLGYETNTDW